MSIGNDTSFDFTRHEHPGDSLRQGLSELKGGETGGTERIAPVESHSPLEPVIGPMDVIKDPPVPT